ncbi:unnamed protein product [Notodromas monacha]|uniref:Uncharacterized protein n=1 Tax=Notodromas monacha TaxID=399045 RepID=A0A7R9BGE4_9CRUS|nr:unnamed protein product [Notodromas monacha]CAG0913388.1 unnamed protein product [Notodromas monacha]
MYSRSLWDFVPASAAGDLYQVATDPVSYNAANRVPIRFWIPALLVAAWRAQARMLRSERSFLEAKRCVSHLGGREIRAFSQTRVSSESAKSNPRFEDALMEQKKLSDQQQRPKITPFSAFNHEMASMTRNKNMKTIVFLAICGVAFGASETRDSMSNKPFRNAASEHGQAGIIATLYAEYCGDLSQCFEVSLDNTISSARVFGIWLFYDGYSYGLNDDLDVIWVWGDDSYYDFERLDNAVSSVRFVGPEADFLGDSVTLFSSEVFKAWEYFIFEDMAQLPGWTYFTDSLIVTGSSTWTLYEYEFYQGRSVCVGPADNDGNPGLYPTVATIGLGQDITISSARRGCFNSVESKPIKIEKNVVYSSKDFL